MNQAVCDYSAENKIRSMGTTAAVLAFAGNQVYGCNLGDSRIYQAEDSQFRRVSRDHVLGGSLLESLLLHNMWGFRKKAWRWSRLL